MGEQLLSILLELVSNILFCSCINELFKKVVSVKRSINTRDCVDSAKLQRKAHVGINHRNW